MPTCSTAAKVPPNRRRAGGPLPQRDVGYPPAYGAAATRGPVALHFGCDFAALRSSCLGGCAGAFSTAEARRAQRGTTAELSSQRGSASLNSSANKDAWKIAEPTNSSEPLRVTDPRSVSAAASPRCVLGVSALSFFCPPWQRYGQASSRHTRLFPHASPAARGE